MNNIEVHAGYLPGAIGRVTELHAAYYSRNWGFGLYFESKVAKGLSEFLDRYDETHDGLWLAVKEDNLIGSIVIDGSRWTADGARLRWFIVAPEFQGRGIGTKLIDRALLFCRQKGFPIVHLSTFAGLDAARRLYERAGFRLRAEGKGGHWGTRVIEQAFELRFEKDGRVYESNIG